MRKEYPALDGYQLDLNRLRRPLFKGKRGCECAILERTDDGKYHLSTSYYVGLDWLVENELPIYVAPKLDKEAHQTDYLRMLFDALKHPEVVAACTDLYEIKWEEPPIAITQQQDLLTPLLVVQFMALVKDIVRKGLKMGYYKVQHNLHARVKGKVLVGQTIKTNLVKNKTLHTVCSYDEFGPNCLENRLLKKTLVFIKTYMGRNTQLGGADYLQNALNYIMPAFANVSEEVQLHEMQHIKANPLFKEYKEAIRLAQLILRRRGYNLNGNAQQEITTPPFWIDMAKLFELYVLGKLKDVYGKDVTFQFSANPGYLDFLLNTPDCKMVIDAKYKPQYEDHAILEDARQLSGYARARSVFGKLYPGVSENDIPVIPCLIIYPNQKDGLEVGSPINVTSLDDEKHKIPNYLKFYRLSIKLPDQKVVNPPNTTRSAAAGDASAR